MDRNAPSWQSGRRGNSTDATSVTGAIGRDNINHWQCCAQCKLYAVCT